MLGHLLIPQDGHFQSREGRRLLPPGALPGGVPFPPPPPQSAIGQAGGAGPRPPPLAQLLACGLDCVHSHRCWLRPPSLPACAEQILLLEPLAVAEGSPRPWGSAGGGAAGLLAPRPQGLSCCDWTWRRSKLFPSSWQHLTSYLFVLLVSSGRTFPAGGQSLALGAASADAQRWQPWATWGPGSWGKGIPASEGPAHWALSAL